MKEKIDFAKKSIEKSEAFTGDPMLEFVILWIGFNALYSIEFDEEKYEKNKVKKFFKLNKEIVKKFLKKNKSELEKVVRFIKSTPQHSKLADYIRTRNSFCKNNLDNNSVCNFDEFVYQIRNNMFHAGKDWYQKDEEKLLKIFNPIFKELLLKFINNKD